jgi:hypothetical protein
MTHRGILVNTTLLLFTIGLSLLLTFRVFSASWDPRLLFSIKYGDMLITEWSQDYGQLRVNRSVGDHPLRCGGITYQRGLGTHANSVLHLQFDRNYQVLTGACGVDDESKPFGSVVCRIISAGMVIFQTPVLRGGQGAAPFNVSVQGLHGLDLVVWATEDGITSDHADWLGLELR